MSDENQNTDIMETANGEAPPEPRWLFYALSAIMPIAGVIIGVIFQGKPDEENRKFGKTCLYIAAGVVGVIVLLYIAMIAIYVAILVVYFVIIFIVIVFYIIFMIALVGLGIAGGMASNVPDVYALLANAAGYIFW